VNRLWAIVCSLPILPISWHGPLLIGQQTADIERVGSFDFILNGRSNKEGVISIYTGIYEW
jgi:hypothetical protein